jgi:hypothetical protein
MIHLLAAMMGRSQNGEQRRAWPDPNARLARLQEQLWHRRWNGKVHLAIAIYKAPILIQTLLARRVKGTVTTVGTRADWQANRT